MLAFLTETTFGTPNLTLVLVGVFVLMFVRVALLGRNLGAR